MGRCRVWGGAWMPHRARCKGRRTPGPHMAAPAALARCLAGRTNGRSLTEELARLPPRGSCPRSCKTVRHAVGERATAPQPWPCGRAGTAGLLRSVHARRRRGAGESTTRRSFPSPWFSLRMRIMRLPTTRMCGGASHTSPLTSRWLFVCTGGVEGASALMRTRDAGRRARTALNHPAPTAWGRPGLPPASQWQCNGPSCPTRANGRALQAPCQNRCRRLGAGNSHCMRRAPAPGCRGSRAGRSGTRPGPHVPPGRRP